MNAINETILQHLLLLAVGVAFLIVTQIIAVKLGFYKYPSTSDRAPSSFFKGMIWAFVLFFVIELLLYPGIAILWLLATGRETFQLQEQAWINLAAILTLAAALGIYVQMCGNEGRKALFGPRAYEGIVQIFRDTLFGAFSLIVSYPVVLVVSQVMALVVLAIFQAQRVDQVAVQHLKMLIDFPSLYWLTVLCFIAVVPLVEETLFRGFLQTSLKEFFGVKGAILITSLIFAVFHFSVEQGVDNIELLTALFVLSCYLGFIYERQRSLFAPVGLHIAFNIVGTFLVSVTK